MQINLERRDGDTEVLRLDGRLDRHSASKLQTLVAVHMHDGAKYIVLDLAHVESIDSSGLGALISGLRAARLVGGDLRIAQPNEQVRKILGSTNLDRILEAYDSIEAALEQSDVVVAGPVAPQPAIHSRRLLRIAEHFRTQVEILDTMRQAFESEIVPLQELLVHQSTTIFRLLANLEERLRPLKEYADDEEANLDTLEQRMNEVGAEYLVRSFAEHLAEQRRRISVTRVQINQQREVFVGYGEAQREVVEVALSRFDSDMDVLERNVAEQRMMMLRMLDAMRSPSFTAVGQFLVSRQDALQALAESGSSDPTEISRSMQQFRRTLDPIADAPEARPVLDRADQADRSLAAARLVNRRPRIVPVIRDLDPDDRTDGAMA